MPPGVRGTGPTPGGRPAHCLFLDNPNSPSRVWGLARALWALALLACAKGPVAGFSGPAGAQAKFCGPFSGGKFCPQVGPQAGPGSQPGPKPTPHPGLTSQAQGGWGKVCVCAHLGPKGGPGHPWTSLYLPLQTGRFSRRERISLVGRVSEIAVISKISAEIAVRADCCAQIFHRYFTDITEISLGFCPSINKIQSTNNRNQLYS